MSVVCFAGGFAFESRMVLLPVKSSYMCFCEFLPASPTGGILRQLSSVEHRSLQNANYKVFVQNGRLDEIKQL